MAYRLLLIDAYSQIYRAYYAIRHLSSPAGQPVNAVYGLLKMTRKLLADQQPTHVAMVYDLGAPRKRLEILPSYKEQRPPTPPDLAAQLPLIRNALTALRLAVVEQEGAEADDLIATLATQAATVGWEVLIASSDKDFTQLVGDRIHLVRTAAKETAVIDAEAVQLRYGLHPRQMVDYLSLLGDTVDNIPGISGVGEKTAVELLQTHGSIEGLLAAAPTLPKPKLRATLLQSRDQLLRNRQLIALDCHLPGLPPLNDLQVQPPDQSRLQELYTALGFKTLLAELQTPPTPDLFGDR